MHSKFVFSMPLKASKAKRSTQQTRAEIGLDNLQFNCLSSTGARAPFASRQRREFIVVLHANRPGLCCIVKSVCKSKCAMRCVIDVRRTTMRPRRGDQYTMIFHIDTSGSPCTQSRARDLLMGNLWPRPLSNVCTQRKNKTC